MKRYVLSAICACGIAACSTTQLPEKMQAASAVPYPELTANEQMEQLAIQVARLEEQIVQLQTRVQTLEARPKGQRTVRRAASITTPSKQPASVTSSSPTPYQQVQQHFARGQYAQAAELLRFADNGGDGSLQAQQNMWLLLQSQQKLGQCQSVIQIGRRFVRQFAQHSQAAAALYAVGDCQWRIQQRDIAKDTWRELQWRYPNSEAARRAITRIEQNK